MGSCCTRNSNLVRSPDPVVETHLDRNYTYNKIQTNINIIPASPDESSINENSRSEIMSFVKVQRQPRSSTVKHLNLVDRVRSGPNSIRSGPNSIRSLHSSNSHGTFGIKVRGQAKPSSPLNPASPLDTESENQSIDSDNSSIQSFFFSRLDLSHSYCKDDSVFSRSSNRSPTVPVTRTMQKARSLQGKTQVNQYTLDQLLGKGAFGRVFKALDDQGQAFAIKVYNKKVLRSKWVGKQRTAIDCVKSEIEIMQALSHPNIIRLVEVIDMESCKKIYLVLELAELGSLHKKCPMDESAAKKYFKDLISGIMYLHDYKNVVHRDIKPQNLLVSKDGNLKICDFGAAQFLDEENEDLNNSAGTFLFMPPEAHGKGKFRGQPADVWACGITLYFMVIGRSPFENKSYAALLEEMSASVLKVPEKASADLKDLILQMTFLEPDQRLEAKEILLHPWLRS